MEKVLISACLLGFECKYCGGSNKLTEQQLAALGERFRLIPVCPETAGGLPTPRDPSERLGDKVVSNQPKARIKIAIPKFVAENVIRCFPKQLHQFFPNIHHSAPSFFSP